MQDRRLRLVAISLGDGRRADCLQCWLCVLLSGGALLCGWDRLGGWIVLLMAAWLKVGGQGLMAGVAILWASNVFPALLSSAESRSELGFSLLNVQTG